MRTLHKLGSSVVAKSFSRGCNDTSHSIAWFAIRRKALTSSCREERLPNEPKAWGGSEEARKLKAERTGIKRSEKGCMIKDLAIQRILLFVRVV
jgi:hypothetical protein